MENQNKKGQGILAIVILIIGILFMLYFSLQCIIKPIHAQEISGYDSCRFYNGRVIGDVFLCSDIDSFGDSIGELKIIKIDFIHNKIIDSKGYGG